jgi:ppGpp synthetase/RelA/SpoT-type nucleotidyltranferase
LDGKPEAHFRIGDPSWLIGACREKGCEIILNNIGYRSIHYPIVLNIRKKRFFVEVQVRSLFEEAWGEVDHHVRYPYLQHNLRLLSYFSTCAAVSGLADELSSIAKWEKEDFELKSIRGKKAKERRLELFDQIEAAIDRLQPLVKEIEAKIKVLPK